MCRRVCYDDGSAKMWGDTNTVNFTHLEGGNDNGIELLYTFDENDKLTGVVANIACPSQVVEQRSYISSDYWGKVKILLRETYGEDIKLTPIEFDILYLLASNPGKVFSTEDIFENVWKEEAFEANNTVMVHIRRLRGKIKDDGRTDSEKIITTVWGVGYKIEK